MKFNKNLKFYLTAFLVCALVIGGTVGTVVGIDKIIHIEGKSDSEIQEILEKLRKKARVRNAQ